MRLYPLADHPQRSIHDLGYADDHEVARGFLRGWYRDDRSWLMAGYEITARVSGGTTSSVFERNVRPDSNLGHAHKRILVDIPGYGVSYCRGVGEDIENPIMACVFFDASGGIADKFGLHKYIGRWNDIVP